MLPGRFGNVILAPVSEILSRALLQVADTISAAKDVLVEQDSFIQLSRYLEKIRPLLEELQEKNLNDSPPLRTALNNLLREVGRSRELISECTSKSRFYLLVNCRTIVKQIQDITYELGRCLSLIPMAAMGLSTETVTDVKQLYTEMQSVQFKAAVAGEQAVAMMEDGMKTQRLDSTFSNELLLRIARAVKVPADPASLREELSLFRKEKEEIELHKDQAEAFQLEQIIGILSRADAATTTDEKESVYRRKRSAGGSQPLPALQSFICPITQEVMDDPVEITNGQTYERAAILKWFSAGHRTCPATKVELESLVVKPNLALRQSIEEWKERNTIISITATRPKLQSGKQEEIEEALVELYMLSAEKPLHRYWILSERLLPEIVKTLAFSHRDVRRRALATLSSLGKNDEIKEAIADEGAIPVVVRSLARDVGESRQAVALLLELSNMPKLLDVIGKCQGCILLLVTMLRSEDASAIEDARQLLVNLSDSDTNVVQMAEANYFKPLISRLTEGSDETKGLMADSLSRMNLTEESRLALAKEGAIDPLVHMLATGTSNQQRAALGALRSLSTVCDNRKPMAAADVMQPLLQLLFSISSVLCPMKEQAAETIANLAAWDAESELARKMEVLQNEDTLAHMVTVMKLSNANPRTQSHILRALGALCSRETGVSLRQRLRKSELTQVVMRLFLQSDVTEVRTNSLKLLFWISKDDTGKELAVHVDAAWMNALVQFISSSQDDEALAAALGVVSNLPQVDAQVTSLLIKAGALPAIASLLPGVLSRISTKSTYNALTENLASALLVFANPSTPEVQEQAAAVNVIPSLVKLLGVGTALTKSKAATALGRFSENSGKRSDPIKKSGGWLFCFGPHSDDGCVVHRGRCTVKKSFCLVEAEAIGPLVQTLVDADGLAQEAALEALTTLLYDDTWENGVHVIAEAQGVRPVVRVLSTGSTGAKEKAVWMLEKVFRFDTYREDYGASAQMPLIDLTQKGDTSTRQLAAKILAHLNILHNQSSYF